MNRRELFRRTLVSAVATGAATTVAPSARALEFPETFDASKDLARADWKPVFLSDHQNQTLIALSDLMIPETETPGAKSALVNRFIDLLLSAETQETRQSFLNSLAFFDGEARTRYGNAFIYVSQDAQIELLRFVAYPNSLQTWGEGKSSEQTGHVHFENMKGWISRIFFSSEAGMRALGWNGEVPLGQLTGCDHEAGQKRAPARAL